ncbi:MAG: F0F1 ATP synthase subunit B family protein [Caulobacteraceae bacterium]
MVALIGNPEWWVGLALVVFVGLLGWLGVHKTAAKGLDAQADKIRAELAEAEKLRKEAEHLLASIKSDRADAERAAAEMIENAEVEARRIEGDARIRLEEQVKRRAELAERKIAQAEAQAAADVKAAAAELAGEAAAVILAGRASAMKSDPLIDRAVADLAGRFQS